MLKQIIKKFPFLYWFILSFRNRLRALIWSIEYIESNYYILKTSSKPFINSNVSQFNPKIQISLEKYNNIIQEEYFIHYKQKGSIEPGFGWILKNPASYFWNSIPYTYYANPPSIKNLIINLFGLGQNNNHYERVVSLRDIGEGNYFHFINDTLTKLLFIKANTNLSSLPIVISSKIYNTDFFKYYGVKLKDFKFIIQDKQHIYFDEIFLYKSNSYKKETYINILEMLKIPYKNTNRQNMKIFIDRVQNNGRTIINKSKILDILDKYGFKTVFFENLSVSEQIDLIYNSEHVIGIHGAGLTNIIYRYGAPLSLLEIFPPNNIPPHYYWLSNLLGYKYHAIVGYNNEVEMSQLRPFENINFYLDEQQLLNYLKNGQ